MADVLLVEEADGIATLTLNRPEARNALSRELRKKLTAAFDAVAANDRVGVVILTGAGKAFSAGLDLKELGGEAAPIDDAALSGTIVAGGIVEAMARCPKPIIGAVNGVAVTGGFEVALACDVLVASREARFADTHARVGILPGWGLSAKLPRLVGIHRAKALSLTGNFLAAEDALAWGLVSKVVEPEELLPTARRLAHDVLSCDVPTVIAYKKLIDDAFAVPFADALRLERQASLEHSKHVSPADVAARRKAIQERGKAQQR